MKFTELLLPVAPNPILLAALLLAAMYLARKPFHRAVLAFSLVINNALRLSAASVRQAEKKLVERNREVLMAEGLENAERLVEREFERINAAVVRDLKGYPALATPDGGRGHQTRRGSRPKCRGTAESAELD